MRVSRAQKKDASSKKPRTTAANTTSRPSSDKIAARAYELFLQRNGAHGHDWDDWLSAERQLFSMDGDSH